MSTEGTRGAEVEGTRADGDPDAGSVGRGGGSDDQEGGEGSSDDDELAELERRLAQVDQELAAARSSSSSALGSTAALALALARAAAAFVVMAAAAAAAAAAWWPVVTSDVAWNFLGIDDERNFVKTEQVHALTWDNIKWAIWDGVVIGVYEPVAMVVKMVHADYHGGGPLDPKVGAPFSASRARTV